MGTEQVMGADTAAQRYIESSLPRTSSGELGSSRLSVRDWLHHLQGARLQTNTWWVRAKLHAQTDAGKASGAAPPRASLTHPHPHSNCNQPASRPDTRKCHADARAAQPPAAAHTGTDRTPFAAHHYFPNPQLASRPLALALPSRLLLMPSRLLSRLERRSVSGRMVRLLPRPAAPAAVVRLECEPLRGGREGGMRERQREQSASAAMGGWAGGGAARVVV